MCDLGKRTGRRIDLYSQPTPLPVSLCPHDSEICFFASLGRENTNTARSNSPDFLINIHSQLQESSRPRPGVKKLKCLTSACVCTYYHYSRCMQHRGRKAVSCLCPPKRCTTSPAYPCHTYITVTITLPVPLANMYVLAWLFFAAPPPPNRGIFHRSPDTGCPNQATAPHSFENLPQLQNLKIHTTFPARASDRAPVGSRQKKGWNHSKYFASSHVCSISPAHLLCRFVISCTVSSSPVPFHHLLCRFVKASSIYCHINQAKSDKTSRAIYPPSGDATHNGT